MYDYRTYLNSLISLCQQILAAINDFHMAFDAFVVTVTGFFDTLLSLLPAALWFLVLLVGCRFVLSLFFPRWAD